MAIARTIPGLRTTTATTNRGMGKCAGRLSCVGAKRGSTPVVTAARRARMRERKPFASGRRCSYNAVLGFRLTHYANRMPDLDPTFSLPTGGLGNLFQQVGKEEST
jgi:hypothetical protein